MKALDPASLPLRDIHLPPPVAWWPPAPGWWLLAAVLILGPLLLGGWLYWRHRTRLRRAALLELARLREPNLGAHALAAGVSVLLRRVSLAYDPGLAQTALMDEHWLARLDALAPGLADTPALRDALLNAPYDPRLAVDRSALIAAVERWLHALPAPGARRRV